MAIYRRVKKRISFKKKRGPYKRKLSAYPKVSTIRAIAKKEVQRQAENKTVQEYQDSWDVYPSNSGFWEANFFPCTPYPAGMEIPQGTGQGERIGNRIKVRNLTIKGTIWPLPYNATTNPTPSPAQVVLYFFINRDQPNSLPGNAGNFFQSGDGARNFQNDLTDVMAKVNTDQYRLFTKRIFKIGFATSNGTGNQPTYQSFSNNDFKLNQNFSINLTKYAYKNVRFQDQASLIPKTRGIFCIPVAISSSGQPYAATDIPIRMSWTLSMTYEDF